MGADAGTTAIIFLIAVMVSTVGVVAILKTTVDSSTQAATIQQKFLSEQIKTSVSVEHAYYNSGTTYVYIRNTGNSQLRPELFTVYVNGNFFKLNETNAQIVPETDSVNTGILDKNEVILAQLQATLNSGEQHIIRVFTQYDTVDIYQFTT